MTDILRTPYFLIDDNALTHNLKILKSLSDSAGCKILLAQKAYSVYQTYPLISQYLCGTTASGLYEARLGKAYFSGECHVYSPAYRDDEFDEILKVADHVVFNSPSQVRRFAPAAIAAGKSVGLRVNPQHSTQTGTPLYDPCAAGSRLGCTAESFDEELLPLLDGLHFHTLCEQNSDALESTAHAFERSFGRYLHSMRWVNFGGGHHITREDYDIDRLKRVINHFKDTYGVQVYLEPGEAVVLNAGYFRTSVLDFVQNANTAIAILDCSPSCHMPDVLEMPYRPPLAHSGLPREKKYTYRLAGCSCLAGDVIGDYSFDEPLKRGDVLTFEDMALYTMVKTNTFNGIPLPAIAYRQSDGGTRVIKTFGYDEFERRL